MVNPVILPTDAAKAGCTAVGTVIGSVNETDEDPYFGTITFASTGYSFEASPATGWRFDRWVVRWRNDAGEHTEDPFSRGEKISSDYDGTGYTSPLADTESSILGDRFVDSLLLEVTAHFVPLSGRLICNSEGVLLCNDAGSLLHV